MPRKESLYPTDWLRIAEKDLQRAEHLLEIHDAEAAGFYFQQAVEKFLKAFLLSIRMEAGAYSRFGSAAE